MHPTEDGHFVDEQLQDRFTDILYSVQLGDARIAIYVLLEHQSQPDELMGLRLLRYMVRIWDRWLAEHPDEKRLPVVLSVVLSHAEGGWTAPTSMHALFDEVAVQLAAPHVPSFSFVLDDLSRSTDEELRGRAMTQPLGTLTLLLLKHVRAEPNLRHRLANEWMGLMSGVWTGPNGRDELAMVVRYVLLANKQMATQDLESVLAPVLGEEVREVIMSTGQQLIEQGKQIGRAEGRAEGALDAARRAVLSVFAARGLSVSEQVQARIVACTSLTTLELWLSRAITAKSAAETISEA